MVSIGTVGSVGLAETLIGLQVAHGGRWVGSLADKVVEQQLMDISKLERLQMTHILSVRLDIDVTGFH